MARKVEIELEYQNYIEHAPVTPKQMYGTACSADNVTIESWRKIWISNALANKKRFGSFKEHSVGKLYGKHQNQPCFVAGSGPSLGRNGEDLKDRGSIPLVSCLHNYQFFEDRGVHVDYFVTLDAGPVVIEEVYEGGTKTPEEYWASTKNKKLLAFIGTDPKLFDLWQGEVYLFNAPVPDAEYMEKVGAEENFNIFVSNGGNVLGACLYIARGILGCNPIAYVGADFSFGYNKKFHAWDSKYDATMGRALRTNDVYGNKVYTWQSYYNFKNWFDYISLTVPGIYVNCTEGGTMGAYPEGNLMSIKQMAAKDFIGMYTMNEHLRAVCTDPTIQERRLLF